MTEPRELRVLHEVARAVADGPYVRDEVLARVASCVRDEFGLARVRPLLEPEEPGDVPALAEARVRQTAVLRNGRVAVPLGDDEHSVGLLVGDRRGELRLDAAELDLLSTVGLVAGLFAAMADRCAELERALEELRRADALKGEFISVASHELRAPIAVVHGIAVTLHGREHELGEERRLMLVAALVEQSGRLRELTEQLLDLSRLEAGTPPGEQHAFHPREAVDALLPRIAPERLDDVEVEIDPAEELRCDEAAFERVVGNLVTNALEYGLPPVRVGAACDDHGRFLLSVEDRGPGVEPEFVPQLFDRFTRGAGAQGGGLRGAGLGLAIARRYAESLGGERFVLDLPG
jgi:signal transduction histidine kinase